MAWRSSGTSNREMIENLYRNGLITSSRVKEAMMNVDRAHYCPTRGIAYEDSPQSIGHSATISAPHMHASAVESLLPYLRPGSRVLDIGSGSGYLTAVFAELTIGESDGEGKVVGLEHIKELRDIAERNMRKSERGRDMLEGKYGKVEFVVGDGRQGCRDGEGGWDAIHVGAAAIELHQELIDQLKRPGRMFIPVEDGSGMQHIWNIDKDEDGNVSKVRSYGVRYVPLTDAPEREG